MEEEKPNLSKEKVIIVEKAPKLVDLAKDNLPRDNMIQSTLTDREEYQVIDRSFTEREGVLDLVDFMDTIINTAKTQGDVEMSEDASLFLENAVLIGENELKKAIRGIADHLINEVKSGKNVTVFSSHIRSQKFISLRILEEIDALTEDLPDLRRKIRMSEDADRIAEETERLEGNILIATPDDFIVSGVMVEGKVGRIFEALLKSGFSPTTASGLIEADMVAEPIRTNELDLTANHGDESERNIQVFSYYGAPEYKNSKGENVVFSGVTMTGSHSSTDYRFEMPLEKFQEYLQTKGIKRDLPLLHHIVKPYDPSDESIFKFKDPDLQIRWENMEEKYKLQKS